MPKLALSLCCLCALLAPLLLLLLPHVQDILTGLSVLRLASSLSPLCAQLTPPLLLLLPPPLLPPPLLLPLQDIEWSMSAKVDSIAVSFVCTADARPAAAVAAAAAAVDAAAGAAAVFLVCRTLTGLSVLRLTSSLSPLCAQLTSSPTCAATYRHAWQPWSSSRERKVRDSCGRQDSFMRGGARGPSLAESVAACSARVSNARLG